MLPIGAVSLESLVPCAKEACCLQYSQRSFIVVVLVAGSTELNRVWMAPLVVNNTITKITRA